MVVGKLWSRNKGCDRVKGIQRKPITGQISIFEYLEKINRQKHCGNCMCRGYGGKTCEHWERGTCPVYQEKGPCNDCIYHGSGDNKYYQGYKNCTFECSSYKKTSLKIQYCFGAPVQKYEDGTMFCPLVEPIGCEECIKEWEKRQEE